MNAERLCLSPVACQAYIRIIRDRIPDYPPSYSGFAESPWDAAPLLLAAASLVVS